LLAAIISQAIMAEAKTPGPIALQLEVFIDGNPTQRITGFELLPDGRLTAKRTDLLGLGVAVPGDGDIVVLSDIPRLKYRYDEAQQLIELRTIRDASDPNSFDLARQGEIPRPESATGMFVNYSLYGSANGRIEEARFTGASALLDTHAFSNYGTLAHTQIIGTTPGSDQSYKRLDTTYSFSSAAHMATFNAGDLVSGGLSWTSPVRMGGLQLKRDFATRPDMVTIPLPSFSGSAAVPSTVDVFVNNVKTYTASVPEGAFELENIPVYSGSGVARIVLHDAQGREVVAERPFYASPDLLRPGLFDYSIEAGWPRFNHGSLSFDYDENLAGSASLRYGLNEQLTAEGHVESMRGLLSGGAGAVIGAGPFGIISAAAEASYFEGEPGAQLHAGWEFGTGNFHLSASSKRSFGDFADIGIATADDSSNELTLRSAEQISLGYGWPEWRTSLGASVIRSRFADGTNSNILSASFSHEFPYNVNFHASGFIDLGDRDSLGMQAGVHIPLGGKYSSSAGVRVDEDHVYATSSVMKSLDSKPGGHGWRVEYGPGDPPRVSALGSYYTTRNFITGTAHHQNGLSSANVGVDGAVALADGDMFLSRRISNAFTIVDTDTPHVPVYSHNRFVGRTGKNGKILLPDLAAYQKNTIRIETDDLPLDAEALETEAQTVVARNSGSVVRFGVKRTTDSALVVFKLKDGSLAPAGSIVSIDGKDGEFVVGYDGQAYLSGLSGQNHVTLEFADGSCRASFAYAPAKGQTVIDEVLCQ